MRVEDKRDLVPAGKVGNPVMSSGFLRLGPHGVSADAYTGAASAEPRSSFSAAIIALTPLYMS